MGDIVPRNQLVKQGVQGIAGIGGGIGLLILKAIASAGFIPGLIAVGAGAVTIVASIPAIGGAVGWLMPVAGVGLIVAGAISLFRFLRNLRRRSR